MNETNVVSIVLISMGIGLILGAKKLIEWNLSYLKRELASAEEKADSESWDSGFAAFQAAILRWQISGSEISINVPLLIAFGIMLFGMGVFVLLN